MNLRSVSLTLVALLSTVGCVSVQAEPDRSAPAGPVRPGNAPAAHASTAPTAPPAVHDALGETEERQDRASGKKRKKKEPAAGGPARRADAVAPPARREALNQPRRAAPARPQAPRRDSSPRRDQRRQAYDMRAVCATGQGVASAEIVALCRTTYGR
ncbi:hypothetical protein ACFY8O_27640 [Streptomyces argenteolus]|uniref:Uncharacterized protein n=1 Tax=Streptomyces argenteolus TaxID=67274 RepID=A0ABW6XD52_9ACTN